MDHPAIRSATAPLDHSLSVTSIDPSRARHIAKILLLCDFDIGGLIRLLRRAYTGDFLDFELLDSSLQQLSNIPPDPGQPPHDFKQLFHLFHHGVPTKASYSCARQDVLQRNLYNNHPAARPHLDSIHPKIASDVQKSYALAIPRWCFRFINGIFLAAIGWATRVKEGKIKGRQVNDPSARVTGRNDTGAVNDLIPSHSTCPETYYRDALERVLTRVYNLRLRYPDDEIIIYKDDLVTAFRRVRYHPDISSAHCFVFGEFLIIPIGLVFGARDSPGWFCQVSEIRAFASQHASSLGLPIPDRTLIDLVSFDPSLDPSSNVQKQQAFDDAFNQGTDGSIPGPQNTFVDDTILVELQPIIRQAAINSVLSAILFIGDPSKVEEPISQEKFEKIFSYINEVLGFVVNSRTMTAEYPPDKKSSLLYLLRQEKWTTSKKYSIRSLARILGTLRNVAHILPFGSHLSINLQQSLSKYVKRCFDKASKQRRLSLKRTLASIWRDHRAVHLSKQAVHDLNLLQSLLQSASANIWKRPISLLIKRSPHCIALSDACTVGLGGFSSLLSFQWRHSASTLSLVDDHINIKEFVAIFINAYFSMISFIHHYNNKTLPEELLPLDGWIFHLFSDNSAAISWMKFASRLRSPFTNRLTFMLSHLVYSFNDIFPSLFSPQFIAGMKNGAADALSRPQSHPTYNSVFHSHPHLRPLTPLRLPSRLTFLLREARSQPSTVELTPSAMTKLLKVERNSLHLSAPNWASQTLHYDPSTSPLVKTS